MPDVVALGDSVLLIQSNGLVRSAVVVQEGQISLGKNVSFPSSSLIGHFYGSTLEKVGESGLQLKRDLPFTFDDDEDATNQLISAGANAQGLSAEDIDALKDLGTDGRDIIAKQVAQHAAFSLKNTHSKSKYIARKESKYLKYFTIQPSTAHNICQVEFNNKGPSKTNELRSDTLSQILCMANVQPGSRVLCVEETSGLLIGSILTRLAGQGSVMALHDRDSPPSTSLLPSFNLTADQMKPYQWLHWAAAGQEYDVTVVEDPLDETIDAKKLEKQKRKLARRKGLGNKLENRRQDFLDGQWDALIISSPMDVVSVVDFLQPYLAGSANLVVHSPYIQPLNALQSHLAKSMSWIHASISEPFLRQFQVLPGRTHPVMNGTGHGGYVFHAINVLDSGLLPSVRKRKR